MIAYSLRFPNAPASQHINFEAEDASAALIIASRFANGRSVELWRDDRLLCALRQDRARDWLPAWYVPAYAKGPALKQAG